MTGQNDYEPLGTPAPIKLSFVSTTTDSVPIVSVGLECIAYDTNNQAHLWQDYMNIACWNDPRRQLDGYLSPTVF